MKPISKLQIFFAEDWLFKIWVTAFVAGVMSISLLNLLPYFVTLGLSIYSIILTFAWLIIAPIAYMVSLIVGSCIFPPIYRLREKLNGAPFETGDVVEILRKADRGRLARIVFPGEPPYGAQVEFINADEDKNETWIPLHQMRKAPDV